MQSSPDPIDQIFENLKSKACAKQAAFKTVLDVFNQLRQEAISIVELLKEKMQHINEDVPISVIEKNDLEFHINVGSDTLVFNLPTNIVTFGNDYAVMKNDYIQQSDDRKFFGQIMVYNFLADTIKYNRLEDPGYLIARIIVNKEKHFYVEGVQQLNFLFTDIENNLISPEWIRLLIEKCIFASIDMDLIGPNYPEIQNTTLLTKLKSEKPMGHGKKVGFQMNYMNDIQA